MEQTGRKTLVISGYAAEVVVLQAVLDAVAAGYTVHYVVDAIGSKSARTEEAAFREMEEAGAIPTSVLSLTTRLTPDFFHSPGSETFAALQTLLRQ
nr:isochorismatase family protein [Novosphingobium sp. fls2-241-R2A-195]